MHTFVVMAIDTRIRSTFTTAIVILLLSITYLINIGLIDSPNLLHLVGGDSLGWLIGRGEVASHSHLVQPVVEWQQSNPTWGILLSIALIVAGAVATMRLTIRYNLFGSVIHLSSLIYAAIIVALITPSQMIIAPASALMMVVAMVKLYDAYTSHTSSPKIFSGCFWIGMLPLIYPSTIPLLLSALSVMVILDRGGREFVLSLWAMVTPVSILLYVTWLISLYMDDLAIWGDMVSRYWGDLVVGHNFEGQLLPLLLIFVVGALSVVAATRIDTISITIVSRQRIIFTMTLVLLALLSIVIPQFAPVNFVVAAAAAAILMTTSLLEMKSKWSTITYLLFMLLVLFVAIFPE